MTQELDIGSSAPSFSLPDHTGALHSLEECSGAWLILYFYPKDNTSGCTAEALAFSEVADELLKINVMVIGISPDSTSSHARFIGKNNIRITLLSDPTHQVIERYGVWKLKKMYGREYYGVERSTFLISPEGEISAIWKKVKVPGHAGEVTAKIPGFVKSRG